MDKLSPNKELEQENKAGQESLPQLSTVKLLLSVVQKEYDYEFERGKNLETRTGIFLTFASAALVFFISSINFSKLNSIKVQNIFQALPFTLLIIFLFLVLLSFIVSVICFIRVISLKTYRRIDLECFSDENLAKNVLCHEEIISTALIKIYKTCIENYIKVNDNRVIWFKYGIIFVLSALICSSITYLLRLFIL